MGYRHKDCKKKNLSIFCETLVSLAISQLLVSKDTGTCRFDVNADPGDHFDVAVEGGHLYPPV